MLQCILSLKSNSAAGEFSKPIVSDIRGVFCSCAFHSFSESLNLFFPGIIFRTPSVWYPPFCKVSLPGALYALRTSGFKVVQDGHFGAIFKNCKVKPQGQPDRVGTTSNRFLDSVYIFLAAARATFQEQ